MFNNTERKRRTNCSTRLACVTEKDALLLAAQAFCGLNVDKKKTYISVKNCRRGSPHAAS